MVFYRKYRPQTISNLDSTTVRETLESLIKKDAIPHAFLFTGPKGLGKTSTARIIAKIVNCVGKKRVGFEPCNTCDACESITNGTNLDVLEIDAASNRGIDEIRDLKEKIRLTPVSAKKKVYIIDEVHMLTTEAFNALLKTLEEPPNHAMFIMCTTEPHKVPATIISRCFHLSFLVANLDEIVHSLKRITAAESIDIEEPVLYEIARIADGGFRDAAKILEEVFLVSNGQRITPEIFAKVHKTGNLVYYVNELLLSLTTLQTKKALETVKTVLGQGVDMKYFLQIALTELDRKLLAFYGVEKTSESSLNLNLREITDLSNILSKAYQETKNSVISQLPLELAIIEYTNASTNTTTEDSQDSAGSSETAGETAITLSSMRRQQGTINKMKAFIKETPKPKIQKETEEAVMSILDTSNTEITPEWQDTLWKNIISETKQHNHMLAGVLRSCSIISYDKKTMIIQAASAFHKDRLTDNQNMTALIKICKILTGNDTIIQVELKS